MVSIQVIVSQQANEDKVETSSSTLHITITVTNWEYWGVRQVHNLKQPIWYKWIKNDLQRLWGPNTNVLASDLSQVHEQHLISTSGLTT